MSLVVSSCRDSTLLVFATAGVALRFLNENFFGGLNVFRTVCSLSERPLMRCHCQLETRIEM